ncbi:MAG: hypothetical protein Q8O72_01990, partial [Bacteroidales bacterium]|nr:hypothetical protein [Bacteroidales bacterium]
LPQPYWSERYYIEDDNYVFVLQFGILDDMEELYLTISKCIDTPDDTWQGLIDILETNFINQFE